MKIQNINLLFLKNQREGFWLYVSILINVAVGYVLDKGYTVQVFVNEDGENEAIIFVNGIMISLRAIFGWCEFEELEYYLKVFLGQEVVPNLAWDYNMTKVLGEVYPRQWLNSREPTTVIINLTKTNLHIYFEFFVGFDLISNQYINNSWAERETKLKHWLDTVNVDLSQQQPVWQKLYEAAVRSINEQLEAPYYIMFRGPYCLKLTKSQYIKVLGIYLSEGYFRKCVDYFVDVLNLEVISFTFFIDEQHRELFHAIFPQVFPCFSLEQWNPAQDFDLGNGNLGLKIKKVYISKLWVKYYNYLFDYTKISQDFPTFKNLSISETAMIEYLDSFKDYISLEKFLWKFLGYLRPLIKSDKEKGYY